MRNIVAVLLLLLPLTVSSRPRQVILDSDWWTDVDDACAIRLLLDAQKSGTPNGWILS